MRPCPGTPSGAITWQGGNLDSAGAKAVESLRVVATGHDLSQPNKISGRRSSTAEHRFCKPLPPARKSRQTQDLDPKTEERAAPGAARHRPEAQTQHNVEAQTPPDLDRVVAAWPGLPQHIKAAVLALVNTAEV